MQHDTSDVVPNADDSQQFQQRDQTGEPAKGQLANNESQGTTNRDESASAQQDDGGNSFADSDDLIVERPPPYAWGFFMFLACALTSMTVALQPEHSPEDENMPVAPLAMSVAGEAQLGATASDSGLRTVSTAEVMPPALVPAVAVMHRSSSRFSDVTPSVITFGFSSIVVSEKAVAAVFVLNRSEPLGRRALVKWSSRSGTADAAIDFSDAAGTAAFVEGQAQVAVYVPIRKDLLEEGDETFTVCLQGARHGRVGAPACAEATIHDDD